MTITVPRDFSMALDVPRPMPEKPSLPDNLEFYTPQHLAKALKMSVSTVRYHLSNVFRTWEGHWRMTYQQALRALRYIEQARYAARRTLN